MAMPDLVVCSLFVTPSADLHARVVWGLGVRNPRLPDWAVHLFMAWIFAARCSNALASEPRPVIRYKPARFSRIVATSGCSGPKAFSVITSERLKSGSALA